MKEEEWRRGVLSAQVHERRVASEDFFPSLSLPSCLLACGGGFETDLDPNTTSRPTKEECRERNEMVQGTGRCVYENDI